MCLLNILFFRKQFQRQGVLRNDQLLSLQCRDNHVEQSDQGDDFKRQQDRILDQALGGVVDVAFGHHHRRPHRAEQDIDEIVVDGFGKSQFRDCDLPSVEKEGVDGDSEHRRERVAGEEGISPGVDHVADDIGNRS